MAADGGPYHANAVDYDGLADYLSKAADFTGNADSRTGIFSAWARLDGGDAAAMRLLYNESAWFHIQRASDNKFYFTMSGGSSTFAFKSASTYTAGATWHHILASWNTNFSAGNKLFQLYIDDVSDGVIHADTDAAFDIDYTRAGWAVAARHSTFDEKFNGALAEMYFAPGQHLDFSVTNNRRKFIEGGKPVRLGSNGFVPTGTPPLLYLPDPAATVNINRATGGNMTINGTPADASTSPSD